jgi:hypothetical protein
VNSRLFDLQVPSLGETLSVLWLTSYVIADPDVRVPRRRTEMLSVFPLIWARSTVGYIVQLSDERTKNNEQL